MTLRHIVIALAQIGKEDRMILHILKKDVRRLWPAIAISLIVLGSLAWHDRWRSDQWSRAQTESYLNLLVPVVWACPARRSRWSRSHSRASASSGSHGRIPARAAGREARVRVRYSCTCAVSLADCLHPPGAEEFLRGICGQSYSPNSYLRLCALTLPAMALASLVRNFSHFVLELVAAATVVLFLKLAVHGNPYRGLYAWEPLTTIRWEAAVVLVAVASVAVLLLQYVGRRVLWSRALAAVAGVCAAALFTWFLPQSALAIRAAMKAAPTSPTLRFDPAARDPYVGGGREMLVALPIAIEGVPDGARLHADAVESEIESQSAGDRGRMITNYSPLDAPPPYRVSMGRTQRDESAPRWLTLAIEPATLSVLQNVPVTLRGVLAATLVREDESVWMGVGETRFVRGTGRCTSAIVEDRFARRIKL